MKAGLKKKGHASKQQQAGRKKAKTVKKKAKQDSSKVHMLYAAKYLPGKQLKLPPHGRVHNGQLVAMNVPLRKVQSLNLKVVHKGKSGTKKNGAKIYVGTRTMKSWGTIRCFSATTCASPGPVSVRAVTDLANQILHSTRYQDAIKEHRVEAGRFVSVRAAEFLSGLPAGWTSPHAGAVQPGSWKCEADARVNPRLKTISLFTGIGGLDLGMELVCMPVEYVECSPFCTRVLSARMSEGNLPQGNVFPDIVEYCPKGDVLLAAEALLAGFPCQGVSSAGSQEGLQDHRSGLIREIFRVWDRMLPNKRKAIFLENVFALLSTAQGCRALFKFIVKACRQRGLSLTWATVSLSNCGLAAGRKRVFLLAAAPGVNPFGPYQERSFEDWAREEWNPGCYVPIHKWLVNQRSEEDQQRMHALGNVVVPRQASLGAQILQKILG
mmetsp:Transcript_74797/g.151276  ORF Transcript_74797/g.151276 Transcript_74797/m.151276 type:complete len:438 (-) Transcript_74797:25-1338(-)